MNLFRLAMWNFKRSVREFGVLVLSLSFSVFIFFNFQNMVYSQAMDVLMEFRKDLIDSVLQAASIVFAVFLFFFIWYAANVFLNQRKKEIGIYIFMGLDNKRISRMYALESVMVGLFSLIFGLISGVLFSKLFQMILLKLSEISVDVEFSFSFQPVLNTGGMFLIIYGFMILKGCNTLRNSSVLNLLSGARQKEIRQENKLVTALRILAGTAALILGYLAALDTGGLQGLVRMVQAVVLVIVGVYLLYSGLIPAILRLLTRNKKFLYRKERTLWINNLAFRIKKNYRTYAMVTVLMICSVTLMALAIALKQRYDRLANFDQVYTEDSLNEDSYIRVTYSLCLFMFVTLMLAAGSIIFLKIDNEAHEDRERYEILEKIGISRKILGRAVGKEICFAYYCPFLLMTVTSYFSVRALGQIMKEELLQVNIWSALFVLVLFTVICAASIRGAKRKIFAQTSKREMTD